MRNLGLAMFLVELNDLQLWGAEIGNAYLQALTREKLYIVAGPEFEELPGHVSGHVQGTLWYKIWRGMLA